MAYGKFAVVEGIEACGKGTVTEYMPEYYQSRGLPYYLTREIGGTPFAEICRRLVISDEFDPPVQAEAFCAYAGRIDHTKHVIRPKMAEGIHVFSERYYASSWVYQNCPEIMAVHEMSLPYIIEPNLTIFLDITAELSNERMVKSRVEKGIALDKIEQRGTAYLNMCRTTYQRIAEKKDSWITIDASQSIDAVKREIFAALDKLYGIP